MLAICLFFVSTAILYHLLVLVAAWRFKQSAVSSQQSASPPVSIFKPVHGAGPHLYSCLETFCRQDYPDYEVLVCVADQADPAVEVVRRLQEQFANLRLLFVDRAYGANAKINSLDKMHREMRTEYMIISDDDIEVRPDYLRRIAAELQDPQAGVVTCLYRGRPGGTVASLFEAVAIAADFFSGVLMARMIEGIRFALGSTMACRKELVDRIGGFPAMADYLADDFELGSRISALGYRGVLASYVVDTLLPSDSWSSMIAHQFRWMRSQAASRPRGHLGLILTYGSVFSLAALAISSAAWSVCALWFAVRLASAWVVGVEVLGDPTMRRFWWLAPLREPLPAILWAASLVFHRVTWRGERYRLEGGKMIRV